MGNTGKSFLQRMRFKYKLAILNENTLEEVWRIRLSKMSVFLFCFFVAVLYFFLIAFLIIKTPLRGFLPGYTENEKLSRQLLVDHLKVDTLSSQLELQTQYMDALRSVLKGEVKLNSPGTLDSLVSVSSDQLQEASEKEQAFRDQYEEDEVMISKNTPISDLEVTKNYLMHSPAKGRVLETFNVHKKAYGVTLSVEQNSNVCSILDGVVISSDYSVHNLYTVMVQHSDNMISVYKTRQPFMKKAGDKIHAGEVLTTFRNESDSFLEFQVWKEGVALDPQTFITF